MLMRLWRLVKLPNMPISYSEKELFNPYQVKWMILPQDLQVFYKIGIRLDLKYYGFNYYDQRDILYFI